MRWSILALLLVGCSSSVGVVNQELPSQSDAGGAVAATPAQDAGGVVTNPDSGGVPDASSSSGDADQPDAAIADQNAPPAEDSAVQDSAQPDSNHGDAAPNYLDGVHCWVASQGVMYMGCDGTVHGDYEMDVIETSVVCPSTLKVKATCSPGDTCVMHMASSGAYVAGKCL